MEGRAGGGTADIWHQDAPVRKSKAAAPSARGMEAFCSEAMAAAPIPPLPKHSGLSHGKL